MKYAIILSLLFFNGYLFCQQTIIKSDTIQKWKDKSFKISPLSSSGGLVIENTSNQDLFGQGNGLKNEEGLIVKFDGKKLMDIMWSVFPENRLQELYSDRLYITFFFTPMGDIIQLSFGIVDKSKITIAEIYDLENKIKSSMKFDPQVSETLLSANFFWKSLPVRFKRIAERTEWGQN